MEPSVPKFIVETSKPVAYESKDHTNPRGTSSDNSRNPLFNRKMAALYPDRSLRILDLGCAGGAFVKDCFDAGHIPIGLEGSDHNLKTKRAEWARIPEHLFTADIVEPFSIHEHDYDSKRLFQANIVTAWELMEHLKEADIPRLAANVMKHLAPGGIWIMSVADYPDIHEGINYHQTVQKKEWWIKRLLDCGFRHQPTIADFFRYDWIRGPLQASSSFHLVVNRDGDPLPPIPQNFQFPPQLMFESAIYFLSEAIQRKGPWLSYIWYSILLIRDLLNVHPRHADIHYVLAYAYGLSGRYFECHQEAHFALQLDPNHESSLKLISELGDFRTNQHRLGQVPTEIDSTGDAGPAPKLSESEPAPILK